MKMVKSLILGSAAGLLAMGGAQAADLPVKAKAVEYVKVCSLYGAGFFYIPGTDTCIKLGGWVRQEGRVCNYQRGYYFSSEESCPRSGTLSQYQQLTRCRAQGVSGFTDRGSDTC